MPAAGAAILDRFLPAMGGALLLLLASASPLPASASLSDYQAIFLPFRSDDGTLLAAVRKYRRGDQSYLLILDPQRFTLAERPEDLLVPGQGDPEAEAAWRRTPFFHALSRYTSSPFPLQNGGLRRAEHPVPGFFLTADLCPSRKPLDRDFISGTLALPLRRPIPLAFMVSGHWLQRHQADFAWLKTLAESGQLAITWVNHSFSHPYGPQAPLERNFLLARKTDFHQEVLMLEQLLIEQGVFPSPFFRFPGLVSDGELMESLRGLSLIPIGSDAWLAKGETPSQGSIILVHGNGNEPLGIRLLSSFYDRHREAFQRGQTSLLPLRDAFLSSQDPF
jgi:hypothetical protein